MVQIATIDHLFKNCRVLNGRDRAAKKKTTVSSSVGFEKLSQFFVSNILF